MRILDSVRTLVGCSAGSIVCFLIALQFTVDEMIALFEDFTEQIAERDFETDLDNILSFPETYGLNDGAILIDLVKFALKRKHDIEDITFMDLGKRFGRNLVVCGTNLTTFTTDYFSMDSSPQMSVITAIRISCSIPLLFTPVTYNDNIYVDGGVYSNFPFEYVTTIDPLKPQETIGVNIAIKYDKIDSLSSYLTNLICSVTDKAGKEDHIRTLQYVCNINVESVSTTYSILSLKIKRDELDTLIDVGYKAMCQHLELLQAASNSNSQPTDPIFSSIH